MIRNTGNGFKDDNGTEQVVPKVSMEQKNMVPEKPSEPTYRVLGVSGIEIDVDEGKEYRL